MLALGTDSGSSQLVYGQMFGFTSRSWGDAKDELEAVKQDLEPARKTAEAASKRAAKRRADAASYLDQLGQAQDRQQLMADTIDTRLDATLAEADSLANVDAVLSTDIRQKQLAIAAQVAAARQAAAAAAARTGRTRPVAGPPTVRAPVGVGGPASGNIVSVGGIQVDSSIAGRLQAMLGAAAASGLVLGGGGYRSAAGQIAVRRARCGPTDYDIYQKPASQCHPGAARPGTSMHEKGLAIDFTCNGALISSRSNPCFGWLASHGSIVRVLQHPLGSLALVSERQLMARQPTLARIDRRVVVLAAAGSGHRRYRPAVPPRCGGQRSGQAAAGRPAR